MATNNRIQGRKSGTIRRKYKMAFRVCYCPDCIGFTEERNRMYQELKKREDARDQLKELATTITYATD